MLSSLVLLLMPCVSMDNLVEAHAADLYNADDAKTARPTFAEGLWWNGDHVAEHNPADTVWHIYLSCT